MKFAGQEKHGPVISRFLRDHGPHTVREVADAIKIDVAICNKALRRMMARGYIQATGEYRGEAKFRAQMYCYVDVEDHELPDPVMDDFERNRSIAAAERIISNLRGAYIPGMFDPFRVLRAQVGGMA